MRATSPLIASLVHADVCTMIHLQKLLGHCQPDLDGANCCATGEQVSRRLPGSWTDFENEGPSREEVEEVIEQGTRIPRPNAVVDVGHLVEGLSPLTRIGIHSISLAHATRAPYLDLLLYPWVIRGRGVGVGVIRVRASRARRVVGVRGIR